MLALAERLNDADIEVGGQRSADAEIKGLRSESLRDLVRSLNQEVFVHKART